MAKSVVGRKTVQGDAAKTKTKTKQSTQGVAAKAQRRVGKHSMRWAMVADMKAQGGRKDIKFDSAPQVANRAMLAVPIEDRGGYPVKRGKGSVDPKDWRTPNGKDVIVDFSRHAWLPDEWGQGVKTTTPTAHSTGTSGGTYTVLIAPDGKIFYHRSVAEAHAGHPFSLEAGFAGQVRLAQLQAKHAIQLARLEIKDAGTGRFTGLIGTNTDASFFKLLSAKERQCLPSKDEFHFGVVSARRATKLEGVRDIFMVQSQLLEAGVTPTWYVDEASLQDYRALGLHAVVGGRLTAARNMVLKDASSKGKACVQLSDDISAWEYREGPLAKDKTDDALNKAWSTAQRFIVSPVAAARFILAKMRASAEPKPQLGGVYMLGSCSRTFGSDAFTKQHFVIGDFFVVDKSQVRFDESMTLKEDYDFSCSHIKTHGSVLRCQRMTLNVKHYANAGGACTNRDKKGEEERRNIDILMSKWPGSFRANPKRKGEVIMRWRNTSAARADAVNEDGNDDDFDGGSTVQQKAPRAARPPAPRGRRS